VGLVSNKLDPDESVGLDAVGPSNIQSLSKISLSGLDTLWIPMVTKRDLMDIPVYTVDGFPITVKPPFLISVILRQSHLATRREALNVKLTRNMDIR